MYRRFFAWMTLAAALLARAGAAESIMASGILTARQEIDIGTELRGTIVWMADEGAEVGQGEPLVKLRDTLERLEVRLRKAQLDAARYSFDRFKKDYESAQKLHAQGVLREEELRARQLDSLVAQSQVEQADAQHQLALENVAMRTICAPTNCVVSKHFKRVGEVLIVSTGVENIMRVLHLDTLLFISYPDVRHIGLIRTGHKADIQLMQPRMPKLQGTVIFVDPAVDPNSGSFRVKVLVPNPGHKVPPGLQGSARFLVGE